MPTPPPDFASRSDWHEWEDRFAHWQDVERFEVDHEGRPKVDHCPGGNNNDRHSDNLSRLTGWYGGYYYHDGVIQNGNH